MHFVAQMTTWLVVFIYLHEIGWTQSAGWAQALRSDHRNGQGREISKNYCGPNLTRALQLICNGVYNNKYKRREETATLYEDGGEGEDNFEDFPFRSRRSALAFGGNGKFRRQTRGIVDECCRKSCRETEMMAYCGRR